MLTTARPLFLDVPATYADPAGLADQQAEGAVSLVVVRYPADPAGPTYDAFAAVSGGLLAVARTTPDYRFPVTPATALARFHAARGDSGENTPTLSLYALDEADCARFLESAYFAECLKLHVDGPASAPLVAAQLARSGCRAGLLELNDFSDSAAPRVALLDLEGVLADVPADDLDADAVAVALAPHLDGVAGRALLYDRAKNRATLPDRAGHGFGLEAAVAQADRLATARRDARPAPPVGEEPPPDPSETALTERTVRPPASPAPSPAATALGALVAELQGARPATGTPTADGPPPLSLAVLDEADEAARPVSEAPPPPTEDASPLPERGDPSAEHTAPADALPVPRSHPPVPANRQVGAASASGLHPLAADLDRLRADVAALFEDAVGPDRARQHEAHVLESLGLPSPVPPEHAVQFLRALLTADPPRRWHLFKRARGRLHAPVADRLMAFHVAHGHDPEPRAQAAVEAVAALWTRLHR